MAERIEGFLEAVRGQIRWKQARKSLEAELRTHLLDQRDALMAQGMDEDAAAAESVRRMGDPVEVGMQLDRVHRPKPQWGLLILVGVILCAGLVIQTTVIQPNLPNVFASVVIGMALMLWKYFSNYQRLGRFPALLYFIGLAALLGMICYTKAAGIYFVSSPAVRAAGVYACMILPVFCYTPLVWSMRRLGRRGFVLSMLAAMPMIVAALMLHSMTAALIAFMVCLTALSVAVRSGWDKMSRGNGLLGLLLFVLLPFAVAAIAAFTWDAAMLRLKLVFHYELGPLGYGYLAAATRAALAQAKVWGNCGYEIPVGDNNLWLTWVICRLGWAVGFILVLLLAALFLGAVRRCVRQRGSLGRMLSCSALAVLLGESVLSILFNLGAQFTGPWVIPFLSTGGVYMVANLLLVGLMLGVFRFEQLPENVTGKTLRQIPPLILLQDGDLVLRLSQLKEIL